MLPFRVVFFLVLLLSMVSCRFQPDQQTELKDKWEIAEIHGDSLYPFRQLDKLSDLTSAVPQGGEVQLRRIFSVDSTLLSKPSALMLGRIVKADRTYLNDVLVGETGSFPPQVSNPWNINRFYPIPPGLLRPDQNVLSVRIYFEPGRGGIFDLPVVGDRQYLEDLSKLRTFYYVDTYKISCVVSLLAGLIFYLIYLKRRRDKKFLYLSLAIFCFAVWSSYHFIWSLPFASRNAFFDSLHFQKLLWVALFGFAYYNSVFLYVFLQRRKYKRQLKWIQYFIVTVIAGLVIAWSPQFLEAFRKLALVFSIGLGVITIFWITSANREQVPYAKSIFYLFLVFASISIADILIDVFDLYLPYLAPVAIPIYLAGLALIVVNQYVSANNEVERISAELDGKNMEIATKNEELSKLDKLKDQFLANTSHELRTPLNGIIGLAESLIDGATGSLPPKTVYNLEMIVSSGKRLTALIGDILDFSQIKSDKLTLYKGRVYMKEITDQVISLSRPLLAGKPLELNNRIPSGLPAVYGDDRRIEQVMFNLIGNAIKFTPSGTIDVYGSVAGNGMVAIEVKDTGIGIPRDKLEDIFNSFEQVELDSDVRKYQGTGLGLAITRKIVELHGGKITVSSELNVGSSFVVTIPVATIEEIASQRQDKDEPVNKRQIIDDEPLKEAVPVIAEGQYKILVVDDEPINLQVLSNHLRLSNYVVETAADGKAALDKIIEGCDPQLVVLDVMMPGMSGFDVCRKIREIYPATNLPVILLTAKDRISDLAEGFLCGANDYIVKPFSKRELLSRIKTHLHLSMINKAYSRFVPDQFINLLKKESIIDVGLGDQIQCDMTVLFCDIRDFTAFSEQMTPKENFDFLNNYLEKVGPIIRNNHGFIDKYIGDAIMALFPGKADDAIRSALDIMGYLSDHNQIRQLSGRPPIRVGIGIHTGSMILGTIGEKQRMESTVISDAVNLASRLEGLTKYYGVSIIVSESSFSLFGERNFLHRKLDRVRVKGKKNEVTIIEVYDPVTDPHAALKQKTSDLFMRAMQKYEERDFSAAVDLFRQMSVEFPEDLASRMFLERCLQYQKYGISSDELVVQMNEK